MKGSRVAFNRNLARMRNGHAIRDNVDDLHLIEVVELKPKER